MPEFAYVAVGPDGQRIAGHRHRPPNEDALAPSCASAGPVSSSRPSPADADTIDLATIRVFERVTRRDVIFFTSQLATIVGDRRQPGRGAARHRGPGRRSRPCKAIVADVRRGVETRHEPVVGAGAAPGGVRRTLRQHRPRGRGDGPRGPGARRPRAAARVAGRPRGRACARRPTYPLLIVGLLAVLLTVLVGFTIPRFARVYQSVNANLQLPLPTRIVQAVGTVRRGELASSSWRPSPCCTSCTGCACRRRAGPSGGIGWLLSCPSSATCRASSPCRASRTSSARLHESGLEVAPSLAAHRARDRQRLHRPAVPRRRVARAGRRLAVARPRRRRRVLAPRHPDGGARREDGADVEVAAAGPAVLRPRSRPCGEPRD